MVSAFTREFWAMQRILEAEWNFDKADSGTTVALLVMEDDNPTLWWAWLGDTRIVAFAPEDSRVTRLTTTHDRVTGDIPAQERQRIKRLKGRFCEYTKQLVETLRGEGGLSMTRSLGDPTFYKRARRPKKRKQRKQFFEPSLTSDPTERRVPGQKGDPLRYQVSPTPSVGYTDGLGQGWSVLLATDGITDFVDDNEARDIASSALTPAAGCAALVARAKEHRHDCQQRQQRQPTRAMAVCLPNR